jgi:hypothetical protein
MTIRELSDVLRVISRRYPDTGFDTEMEIVDSDDIRIVTYNTISRVSRDDNRYYVGILAGGISAIIVDKKNLLINSPRVRVAIANEN